MEHGSDIRETPIPGSNEEGVDRFSSSLTYGRVLVGHVHCIPMLLLPTVS